MEYALSTSPTQSLPPPTTWHDLVCTLPTASCISYRDVHPWASVCSPTLPSTFRDIADHKLLKTHVFDSRPSTPICNACLDMYVMQATELRVLLLFFYFFIFLYSRYLWSRGIWKQKIRNRKCEEWHNPGSHHRQKNRGVTRNWSAAPRLINAETKKQSHAHRLSVGLFYFRASWGSQQLTRWQGRETAIGWKW